MSVYSFLKGVVKPIIKLIFPKQIIFGMENVPKNKGFILCCNHTHFMDVAFLIPNFKRKINFMAKKELFKNKLIGKLFLKMGAFPVDRGSGSGAASAIKTGEEIVNRGEILGIFPEGTRSKDGKQKKAKSGVAIIAYETKAPILPVSIYYEGKLKLFKKISIRIGEMIYPNELNMQSLDRGELKRVSSYIMDKITKQWEEGHCK